MGRIPKAARNDEAKPSMWRYRLKFFLMVIVALLVA
jgi:hypothetical protein